VAGDGAAVAGGEPERQLLAVEVGVALPLGAPVVAHGLPSRPRPLHRYGRHVTGAADVGDQHQVEGRVAGDGEPDAARLGTRHSAQRQVTSACITRARASAGCVVSWCHCHVPPVLDGHHAGAGLGDLVEHWRGKIEVHLRRVAPAAVVVGERVVGWAEVGGRHHGGAPPAAPAARALDLEARTTAPPVVEQRRAQRRRVFPVPCAVQVAIPARSSCTSQISTYSMLTSRNETIHQWPHCAMPMCSPIVPEASLPP
jgi:hypothetical protein